MKICDCSYAPCGAFCIGKDCENNKHKTIATKGNLCNTCYYASLEGDEPEVKTRKTKFSHEED